MRLPCRPRVLVAVLGLPALLALAYGIRFVVAPPRFPYRTFPLVTVGNHVCDNGINSSEPPVAGQPPIPNFVHYVWLIEDRPEFKIGFKFFVSVFSAHHFWRPERIYIHTDASPDVIARARTGTRWTRRVLAMPELVINHVEAPLTTQRGVKIERTEHKSDFLRLAVLREYGGIYLDTDAMPLRDIADLRNSGFRNVIGQQMGLAMWVMGYLNNGVMMAVPNSNLITIFYHAAHEFFDGQWDTASIKLLTDLGNRLALIPSEVLLLQPQAFSPTSFEHADQKRLFEEALTSPAPAPGSAEDREEQRLREGVSGSGTCRDVLSWLKHRERMGREDPLELDFSSTYVLHAFDSDLEGILGKGREIDVKYVLAQRSNYARALFPAVWQAVQEGIIPQDETG